MSVLVIHFLELALKGRNRPWFVTSFVRSIRLLLADQQVSHVLSRLAFGARPGDAQRVRELGVDRWIDLQLHPERIDDSATEQFLHENYKLLDVDAATLRAVRRARTWRELEDAAPMLWGAAVANRCKPEEV